ncbi:MAG: sulfatase [Patescibacteria group bacterium]
MSRIGAILFVLTALLIGFWWQRNKRKETPQVICRGCNVVFVSFDTLRAKNVHALGYPRNTTPNLDKLAKTGFTFNQAMSVAPWTLPSTMSWFTGAYPSQHKVLNKFTLLPSGEEKLTNLGDLSPSFKTLAEIFRENGYWTGGFTGGAGVDHQFGFNQGFEVYTDEGNFAGFRESVPQALNWIKAHKDEKMFVFLHGYDVHGQYVPEGGYDRRFVDFDYQGRLTGSKEEQKELREEGLARGSIFLTPEDVRFLTALYDEKIQRADSEFGRFIAQYHELGLMEKTIFVITSDHGEELYEHGRIDHGQSLYDELLHVPLIILVPGVPGKIIETQVRSIDLMPTILELTAISPPESVKKQMAGTSLVPLLRGQKLKLDVFPETDYRYAIFKRSIRTRNNWKYILDLENKLEELYDISSDRNEQDNLVNNKKDQLGRLRQLLRKHLGLFKVAD